ncbi:MAG: hypothetical protein H7328_13000 [Bdellovibrio sp.]|nr:hypothetical protein [Bdellovibrio sp.]
MKSINLYVLSAVVSFTVAQVATAASTTRSDIKDFNYVCMHITKPEALVFKTTSPQKIWRTSINANGEIKKDRAMQLGQIQINAQNLKDKSKVATFKADMAVGYQIKGLFEQDTDGELPLTVVSSYLPDGITGSIKDHYNCELQQEKTTHLGSAATVKSNEN